MALNFSANLNTLFCEVDLVDRFKLAREYGFKAFELLDPYTMDPVELNRARGDMECDLLNFYAGPSGAGSASLPLSDEYYEKGVEYVNVYNNLLQFKKLHIMSGNTDENLCEEDQFNLLVNTLKSFVDSDFLDTANIMAVIEPICEDTNSKYFLNSFDMAVEVLKRVNDPNVKLLLDVYHLHKITKDVQKYLDVYYPYAGHIQVSQDPGRTEPFCSGGLIDYHYVFDYLRSKNHKSYIGLEYRPSGPTETTLGWIKSYSK